MKTSKKIRFKMKSLTYIFFLCTYTVHYAMPWFSQLSYPFITLPFVNSIAFSKQTQFLGQVYRFFFFPFFRQVEYVNWWFFLILKTKNKKIKKCTNKNSTPLSKKYTFSSDLLLIFFQYIFMKSFFAISSVLSFEKNKI